MSSDFHCCSARILFSLGIDATKLVKSWQVSTTHCALVGGAAPDHYISLENLDKDSIIAIIEEYRSGKKGILAEEVKVCLLVFQHMPPGMSPYFVLIRRPQTINERSSFNLDGKW